MSDVAAAPSPLPLRRDRTPLARQAARAKKVERDRRILALLNRGVSVAEIAERESVSLNHMRNQVRTILLRRLPPPPAEYLALQVCRLNEALLLSYNQMYNPKSGADFKAIDHVVKIVRELDRYHGFAAPRRGPEPAPRPAAMTVSAPLALAAPDAERIDELQMAPQPAEKV